MMRIVVLDGFTLNPGDLSWDELAALGQCEVFDRTAAEEVVSRAIKAQVLLTNKTVISKEHLARLPELKYIGVLATGTDVVDIAAASARGIVVTNVPAYGTASVAQATIALLLELSNHVGHHAHTTRQGLWSHNRDWCYWEQPLVELEGLTIGIVGFGRIGSAVGELARAFGMTIITCTPSVSSLPEWAKPVDLPALFRCSDVITLHCPLTPETRNMVNAEGLAVMKPTAFLLNTSRGALIDEAALAAALNAGSIAGAGLDVLSAEPPPADHPLLRARNCLVTPHQAWATRAARWRLMKKAANNVKAFIEGRQQNAVRPRPVVSPEGRP